MRKWGKNAVSHLISLYTRTYIYISMGGILWEWNKEINKENISDRRYTRMIKWFHTRTAGFIGKFWKRITKERLWVEHNTWKELHREAYAPRNITIKFNLKIIVNKKKTTPPLTGKPEKWTNTKGGGDWNF
jgi:hypothetical protein